jgi:hypothetical protein
MPIAMERALKKEARKKGLSKERAGAYVYGTMMKNKARAKALGKGK